MNRRFLPLCLLGSGLLLAACQREQGSLTELEARMEELEDSLTAVKKTATQLRKDLTKLSEARTTLEEEADAARVALVKMVADRDSLKNTFAAYKAEYHDTIIKRAIGMVLGEVAIGSVTYHNSKVRALDPWELSLQHDAGVTRIELVELPESLKTLFGYDPSVGAKPERSIASLPVAPPSLTSVDPVAPPPSPAGVPEAAPAQTAPRQAAEAPDSRSTSRSSRSSSGERRRSGGEVITRFTGLGAGGGYSGGGSSVKGGVSEVPENYKPIGSSFSGSAMDRDHKKEKR